MAPRAFLESLRERVLLFDGATGTALAALGLTSDDYEGRDGFNEILVRTRPNVIEALHASYLEAGSDVVSTDSFSAIDATLDAYGLRGESYALCRQAAEIARRTADACATPDKPRYVAGSLGPGTRLPSLGQVAPDELARDYRLAARGLLEGGVDLLLLETTQDLLQIKTALIALRAEMKSVGRRVPVAVTVTLESGGSLLVGSDLTAVAATLLPLKPDLLGLNCSFGPKEMAPFARELSRLCGVPLLAQPNAGLPERREGREFYPLEPGPFADLLLEYVREDGFAAVGGCCGTRTAHIKAASRLIAGLAPKARDAAPLDALSSLYRMQPLRQEPRPFLIGERTNANGSKAFREALLHDDLEAAEALAKRQEADGAHALDLCVAYVGRDEGADMRRYASRLAQVTGVPLCLDSTRPEVLAEGLKVVGGRPLINSINLEDGEAKARAVLELARTYGAAVVALTIDESGMAREAAHKLRVAERLLALAAEYGLGEGDVLIDMLTFTVADTTGEVRDPARQTLNAIRAYKQRHPEGLCVLGVSNVSYGLPAALRPLLNSVFLAMAVEAGLDAAIVDAAKIRPLTALNAEAQEIARALLRSDGTDGAELAAFLRLGPESAGASLAETAGELWPRIRAQILSGTRAGLDTLLAAALTKTPASSLVGELLIPAMQEVGVAFGEGRMPLPFVLQAAETMRAGLVFLEPHLRQHRAAARGKLVLATVKGDVHDIGKNLVDVIVGGNGFEVLNLGIRVSVEEMRRRYLEEGADAIGMSGLLVKSTEIMRENLLVLAAEEPRPPVILGGAALTRSFVEGELRAFYGPDVHYAADAFEGLRILEGIVARKRGAALSPSPGAERLVSEPAAYASAVIEPELSPLARELALPEAPYFGARGYDIPLREALARLNRTSLFVGRWHYRRGSLSAEAHAELLQKEAEPALAALLAEADSLFFPRARLGFWPCFAQGETLFVLDPKSRAPLARFRMPARKEAQPSLASAFHGETDRLGLLGAFVVTIGPEASRAAARLYERGAWRDYLHLHGLGVELAEACADWTHEEARRLARVETNAGFRASFGYPALPDLADQAPLMALLDASAVGIELGETFQMWPEQSVSALIGWRPASL